MELGGVGSRSKTAQAIHRNDKNVDESALAQFSDGQLILLCRPDGGVFHSRDDGYNWSQIGQIVKSDPPKFNAPRMTALGDDTVVCGATLLPR